MCIRNKCILNSNKTGLYIEVHAVLVTFYLIRNQILVFQQRKDKMKIPSN